MGAYDPQAVDRAVTAGLSGPGGIALVVNVFAGLTGVVHTPARRGLFRSDPERIQIGDWRYEVTGDGRLRAAHLVSGIVLAEDTLDAAAVGPHIARALSQVVARHGDGVVPGIDAAVEALRAGGGS